MKYYRCNKFDYSKNIGKFCCYQFSSRFKHNTYIQFMCFIDKAYNFNDGKYPASIHYYGDNKINKNYYYNKKHIPNIKSNKEWRKYVKLLAFV